MKITDNIKLQFGKWFKYFEPFISTPEFDTIFLQIKSRVKAGVKVFPASENVFRCFRETDPDKLKVILASFCPYHNRVGDIIVGDGLAFSCSNTGERYGIQPSLHSIYSALEDSYCGGFNINLIQEPDLRYLAYQGVLLYNTGLTVEEGKAGSMQEVWKPFNEFFWKEVINQYFRGLPIVFFGQVAAKSEKLLTPMLHYPYIIEHPASSSYRGPESKWKYDDIFRKVDKILMDNNGEKIEWYKESNTMEKQKVKAMDTSKALRTLENPENIDDLPF